VNPLKKHSNFSHTRLVRSFNKLRVIVVGDVMLDTFTHGTSTRNSPEAPVPVVDFSHNLLMPGGAANAAMNAASLGAHVTLFGIIGLDTWGLELEKLMRNKVHMDLVRVSGHHTTHKHRIVSNGKHALRIDYEVRRVPLEARKKLRAKALKALTRADVLVIADYAKGALEPSDIRALIHMARVLHKPVVVDTKPAHRDACVGATVLTPNCGEARAMTGATTCKAAGVALAARLGGAVLVTAGARGMYACVGNEVKAYSAYARDVRDVSGAGDTVTVSVALTIAAGGSVFDAAHIASVAAAIVVSKQGTAKVERRELEHLLTTL
jgi:D-beta-D-heptose 7-phosphate kinase/D-beta-D-heptose 1-phosphate adenosyltransferase